MGEVAIEVYKLSKRYRLGGYEPYGALRDVIYNIPKIFFRRKDNRGEKEDEFIWALRDVSFEIEKGEVVGLIGRNGAGKTTLLKILSKITYPTTGYAKVRGRVSSLLEVAIGFHPELTGRENVYLYGNILGMSRKEISKKFDEIVAFSELEKFIDTPVKYYSSGMYVRLAFSVAAHLEPDILLVDEVIAVGDIGFQKKSFKKMGEMGKEERTVIVVSHNMDAILRLCGRAILLDKGKIVKIGNVREVVELYLKSFLEIPSERLWDDDNAPGDRYVRIKAVRLKDAEGNVSSSFDVTKPIFVEVEYDVLEPINACACIVLHNSMGVMVFISGENHDLSKAYTVKERGRWKAVCEINANLLTDGTYTVRVVILSPRKEAKELWHVDVSDAVSFQTWAPIDGTSARGDYGGGYPAVVMPKLRWESQLQWRH